MQQNNRTYLGNSCPTYYQNIRRKVILCPFDVQQSQRYIAQFAKIYLQFSKDQTKANIWECDLQQKIG